MPLRRLHFSPDLAFWSMISLLLALSAYFVYDVEVRRRGGWGHKRKVEVRSGSEVSLLEVMSGHQLSLATDEGPVIVRLVGIKCFSAKVNEPGISAAGHACIDAVRRMCNRKQLVLEYDKFKRDKHKRVLAYLRAPPLDVGLRLVELGHAMVYTKYEFPRVKRYLEAEAVARRERLGLWGNPRTTMRAIALKAMWEAEP